MKRAFVFVFAILICACTDSSNEEDVRAWEQLPDFPGDGRAQGIAFTAGGNFFVGVGLASDTIFNSFWKFNNQQGKWAQVSNVGFASFGSVAFTINNKGYFLPVYKLLGTSGFQGTNKFYSYNDQTDSWQEMKKYSGELSVGGVSFVINGKGFILVGASFNSTSDRARLFRYDPITDEWSEMAEIPNGAARTRPAAFVVSGKAYIVGGEAYLGTLFKEVWEYDPVTNSWTKKNDFPGPARHGFFGFSINDKGYLGSGTTAYAGNAVNDTQESWKYDPVSDQWEQLPDYPGLGRYGSYSASDGEFGYIFGGSSAKSYYNDFWKFNPKGKQ